jgi:hypothetical protein
MQRVDFITINPSKRENISIPEPFIEVKSKTDPLKPESFQGKGFLEQETENQVVQIRFSQELEMKDLQLKEERLQRQQLESVLQELQQKFIAGGETTSQAEKEKIKAKRQKRENMKNKARREPEVKKDEVELKDEEIDKLKYQNLQEEADELRKILKKVRMKLKGSLAEIEDLNKEHEREKEELLDTIRSKERENDFLHKVFEYMLPAKEIFRIKKMSKYDEINNQWHVKPFVLQNKQTIFPKLPKVQIYETIQADLRNRTLVFTKAGSNVPILEEEDEVNENTKVYLDQENKEGEDYDVRPITSAHANRDFNSRRLQTKFFESRELDKRNFYKQRNY